MILGQCVRDHSTNSWKEVATSTGIQQVSVGSSEHIWGITTGGTIVRWDTSQTKWVAVSGSMVYVDVDSSGNAWGSDASGFVYYRRNSDTNWTQVSGNAAQISASFCGEVWRVNTGGNVFFSPNNIASQTTWYRDSDGDTFGDPAEPIDSCGAPTGYVSDNTDCNDATALSSPGGVEVLDGVDNDCDGSIDEGFDPANAIDVTWAEAGSMAQVSVGATGEVWAIDADNDTFKYDHVGNQWLRAFGQMLQIDIGHNEVWGINEVNQVRRAEIDLFVWVNKGSNFRQVSVGEDDTVWAIGTDSKVSEWNESTEQWTQISDTNMAQISLGGHGHAWGITTGGTVVRWDSSSAVWVAVSGTMVYVSVDSVGNVSGNWP